MSHKFSASLRLCSLGWWARVVAVAATAIAPFAMERPANALITGGEGNAPIHQAGWPAGTAEVFNDPGRVAYWEGPPFGGGQWHAEVRGDAAALSRSLVEFARLDVKNKRIVVHDGQGYSFWLNPNRDKEKAEAAKIDWTFSVWQPANWERLRKLPGDLNPTGPGDAENGPPAQIDVYTGGGVKWADVIVPRGLDVDDQRLEAHGYSLEDGFVIEGQAYDLATGKPLFARAQLQKVEPKPEGGYSYPLVAESSGEMIGRFVLKNAPQGWGRIVVSSEGYVPRVVGYVTVDEQPRWNVYRTGLSKPAPVAGRIVDDEGKPLADVSVRLGDVVTKDGRYESPDEYEAKTDSQGSFRFDRAPAATATVWVHKAGYCRPGLGLPIETPKEEIELAMKLAAQVRVTVDFQERVKPEGYIVQIEPEGGSVVGSWGGSGNIDAENKIEFKDVPPGRYVLQGRPNPSNGKDQTESVTVELVGGKTNDIKLLAKP